MYKASKYEVSPDLKHVLLAYNVAPVSFSFVCLFFELANWQPNMSAASTGVVVVGWYIFVVHWRWGGGRKEGGRQEKVIMAGCEGLSHTAACQRWQRGASTAEWNCSEGGRNTNKPLGVETGSQEERYEISRRNRKHWLGMYHCCEILCPMTTSGLPAPWYVSKHFSS